MPVQVLIPAPMRSLTGQQARVSIDGGATVGEVLTALALAGDLVDTVVVVILPDGGRRYLSTALFEQ